MTVKRSCLGLTFLLLLVLPVLGEPPVAGADSLVVTSAGATGPGTLTHAIAIAQSEDIITFDLPSYPATIVPNSTRVIDHDLTGQGGWLAYTAVVAANASAGPVQNTATITAAEEADPANNQASATVTILRPGPGPEGYPVYLPLVVRE